MEMNNQKINICGFDLLGIQGILEFRFQGIFCLFEKIVENWMMNWWSNNISAPLCDVTPFSCDKVFALGDVGGF